MLTCIIVITLTLVLIALVLSGVIGVVISLAYLLWPVALAIIVIVLICKLIKSKKS